ncbi:MAG: HD domain-containing protein [Planctomycetes bacterium]|nr:HD domain-containing protein [Planctomycetota bacterium]
MIINEQIPLHRLLLSLSQTLDFVHHSVVDHQQRTTYIAVSIAKQLGVSKPDMADLFFAAILHDIGLIGVENRISGIHKGVFGNPMWHCETGYNLLKNLPLFTKASKVVRFHHLPWENGKGTEYKNMNVPFLSHILVLADSIERMIDRNVNILDQSEFIVEQVDLLRGEKYHPDCVNAFHEICNIESFWLDCVSNQIYNIIVTQIAWPTLILDEEAIAPIARIFANVIDATSKWTATHSSGVATAAVELSDRLHFSDREKFLMRSAGYFHDIGKLTIPTSILDKPDKLSTQERHVLNSHTYYTFNFLNTIGGLPQVTEWAAFHHERLDGNGYPFHHNGKVLTLGSRIMAVADVFAALTEDRPYHKKMDRNKALSIINKLAGSSGLDYDVVKVLEKDYDNICDIVKQSRQEYATEQKELLKHILPKETVMNV